MFTGRSNGKFILGNAIILACKVITYGNMHRRISKIGEILEGVAKKKAARIVCGIAD